MRTCPCCSQYKLVAAEGEYPIPCFSHHLSHHSCWDYTSLQPVDETSVEAEGRSNSVPFVDARLDDRSSLANLLVVLGEESWPSSCSTFVDAGSGIDSL